jgi:sulfur carrier protein
MTIYINDESTEIDAQVNLGSIIESLPIRRKKGIAVAVDNQVVTRDLWPKYYPKENARIVIITATQGG